MYIYTIVKRINDKSLFLIVMIVYHFSNEVAYGKKWVRYALKKKNDIIWEFFPNVGPPPPPPPFGNPFSKKKISVYFAF